MLGWEQTIDKLNGSQVNISQKGLVTIKIKDTKGAIDTVRLKLGDSLAPLNFLDTKTIHFTPYGVDIRGPQGETLCMRSKERVATIPIRDLPGYQDGHQLVSVWESITGHRAPKLPSSLSSLPDATSTGRKIPTKVPEDVETLKPNAVDALWLLNEYLNHVLPNGGRFWNGDKATYPRRKGTDVGTDTYLR